jgi:pyruvate dehydrogenase E2 component (dihydrolipoamide acetyltransferase)
MMKIEIKIPDLGTTSDEMIIIDWLVSVGQTIERGQPILEVETDKSVMGIESTADGILEEIYSKVDDTVTTGQIVAIIEANVTAPVTNIQVDPLGPKTESKAVPVPRVANPYESSDRKSFFARNRKAKASRSQVTGEAIRLTTKQRAAARRLQQSKLTVPHFYLHKSMNAEPMINRRKSSANTKMAFDAFFIYAASRAIKQFSRMACFFKDNQLLPQTSDAIGLAVDLDDDLFVIPIHGGDGKAPELISDEIRNSVNRIRKGDASASRLQPGVMTITNLGMAKVDGVTSIINPPESCILGIGQIKPKVVVVNGEIITQKRVQLSLSVDHRIANGRYAANFFNAIINELEAL